VLLVGGERVPAVNLALLGAKGRDAIGEALTLPAKGLPTSVLGRDVLPRDALDLPTLALNAEDPAIG
jgi:hypothetical protein